MSSKSNWRKFRGLKFDSKKLARHATNVEKAGTRHAHDFLVKRWRNVRQVRRHMLSWLLLVAVLIGLTGVQLFAYQKSYTHTSSIRGGIYAEGVVGPLSNINPLFATTEAERSASHLIFDSLLSYDKQNKLRDDLAQSWHEEGSGKQYVVNLRKDITWHDGQSITAKDVVFTVKLMQNPNVDSPFYSSWQGIQVSAPNSHTVVFTLPAKYSPFPQALTFGILPEHIFKQVTPANLRAASDSQLIGSGPFVFSSMQGSDSNENNIVVYMHAFKNYFRGQPRLSQFQLHVYGNTEELLQALKSHEVNAASGLSTSEVNSLSGNFKVNDVLLNNGVYAILRTDSPALKDSRVRQALRLGTNLIELRDRLHEKGHILNGPILPSQTYGVAGLYQPGFNKKEAEKLLAKAGWKVDRAGVLRNKKSQILSINLASVNGGNYPDIVKELSRQWSKLGIEVKTNLVNPEDVQQVLLQPRSYDVLVYKFALGGDPDVYAYWHSSQATKDGLNLADYNSPVADDALLSARARVEPELRSVKYRRFVQQWLKDVPAIALYQPTLHYVTLPGVRAISYHAQIVSTVDRYRSVEYWTVNRANRYNTP